MRVKLVWIEQDFRGNHLSTREELLEGESAKNLTRNHVARLIARHHPEPSSRAAPYYSMPSRNRTNGM